MLFGPVYTLTRYKLIQDISILTIVSIMGLPLMFSSASNHCAADWYQSVGHIGPSRTEILIKMFY